jgi:hypothetical protein
MSLNDRDAVMAIGACVITLLIVSVWLAIRISRRNARAHAGWRRYVARSRALSDLSRIFWGPPKLTDQREKTRDL